VDTNRDAAVQASPPDHDQVQKLTRPLLEAKATLQTLMARQTEAGSDSADGSSDLLSQAYAKLRESEIRFQAIFEGAGFGVVLMEPTGRIMASNPALQEMLGYSEQELAGLTLFEVTHPDDLATSRQFLQELVTSERVRSCIEQRYIGKDHLMMWGCVSASVVRDAAGQSQFIIGMIENITERKQMEAELAEVRHRLSESQEAQRFELARELHDGPIQDLYSLGFQLKTLSESLQDEASRAHLAAIQEMLQQTTRTLRATCHELRPPTLAPFGLKIAIRSHAEHFQELHPELEMRLDLTSDGQTLPEHMRLALFRIYQQALNNAALHSGAKRVDVHFQLSMDRVVLEIKDDGHGFKRPQRWIELARKGHLGLVGAIERAEMIGGRLEIISAPGEGTTIRVVVPRPDSVSTEGQA
jgi:PAS domain S-box-containing protein